MLNCDNQSSYFEGIILIKYLDKLYNEMVNVWKRGYGTFNISKDGDIKYHEV